MATLWYCVHGDCVAKVADGQILCREHYKALPETLRRLRDESWPDWANRVRGANGLGPLPRREKTTLRDLGRGVGRRSWARAQK